MSVKATICVFLILFLSSFVLGGLVHRWSFSDGDTTAVDSVGSADGTLENGAVISGNAVQLDGTDDYVNLPGNLITGFSSVTLEAWFTYTSGTWTRLFDFGDTNDSNYGRYYFFYTPYSGAATSRIAISDTDPGYRHEEQVNAFMPIQGVPVHVVCMYDGDNSTMSLYINGMLADSVSITIPLSAVDNVYSYLGRSLYPDPYLQGAIDEFRIYNHALNSEEILVSYNLGPDEAHAQYLASNPDPAKNLVGVVTSKQLSWSAPSYGDPNGYTVYVSDNPDLVGAEIIEVTSGTSCSPTLDYSTTYYWRVDSTFEDTYEGVLWNFTTYTEPLNWSSHGDINGDLEINILDLELLANNWLTDQESNADLIDQGDEQGAQVNNADYAQLAGHWLDSAPKVVINEFMADNRDLIQDGNGDYDDWIEIFNATTSVTVDLSGMYLTDDLSVPDKWQIPQGTTIAPQEYLLFWADNEEVEGSNHTNFKLDAGGEEIGLFDTDGTTLIDSIVYDDQYPHLSYGRFPDNGEDLRFFDIPTPEAGNIQGYVGVVSQTEFSVNGGLFSDPTGFDVAISCDTPGVTIYYTTDFTDPSESSLEYTGPIHIDSTICLRATAFKSGWLPNHATSSTYIYLDDVMNQSASPPGFPTSWGSNIVDYEVDPDVVEAPEYSDTFKDDLKTIPSICIVIPNDDFFGAAAGLYANATQRGEAWEKEASIEFVDPCDTGNYIQANAGLRAHGGVGRVASVAKHSLRIIFRSIYGPGKLEFPLFEDSDVDIFDQLVLRATWNYSWTGDSGGNTQRAQYMRELYAHDTIREMDRLQGYGRHVHVYINGLYWGLYILTERPDDGFASEHLGGSKSDYDVIKTDSQYWAGPEVIELVAGDRQAWDQLFTLAETDLSDLQNYTAIQEYVDIPSLIDYMLMVYHTGSRDAPVLLNNDTSPRNFYAIRKREPGAGFVFLPWDVEWSLEDETVDRVNVAAYINGYENPAYLIMKLKANEDFRMLMADHVHKHYFNNGVLTEANTIARYLNRITDIDRAIVGESARWGDSRRATPYTRNVEWITERDRLANTYFPARESTVLSQLRTADFYPDVESPIFNINDSYQHGGQVNSGDTLTMITSAGLSYVEEILLDAVHSVQAHVPVDDSLGLSWTQPGFLPDSSWTSGATSTGVGYERSSGYGPLIGTDVEGEMYNNSTSVFCRVNFTHDGTEVDQLQLQMKYDDGFIAYLNGTEICRSDNIVSSNIPGAKAGSHEANASVYETFDITSYKHLLASGDNVLAIHGINEQLGSSDLILMPRLVAQISLPSELTYYTTDGSDPRMTGGTVNSGAIEYNGPISLTKSAHIKSRVLKDDVWSALNEATFAVGPVAENLRITELMYHPADPNTEFIELKNIGNESINLNQVAFSNGVDCTFGDVSLTAGQYALLVQNQAAFEAKYGTGLNIAGQYTGSLDNGGEKIELIDAIGTTIHSFSYKDGWYDITDGGGFSLTIKDPAATDPNLWDEKAGWQPSAMVGGSPGTDDTGSIPAIGSVVINELLAHSDTIVYDWIELHNTTAQPINIGGWFLSDDNDGDPNRMKYEIAAGTSIPGNGYIVFYENVHFGNLSAPGCNIPFQLSENGETLYLQSGQSGVLTGYVEEESFGASDKDIAFGRYQKSTGSFNFVAMSENSPREENAYPKVGPVVMTEIMYHPQANSDAEYVELKNISGSNVTLYDFETNEPWRFVDDADDPGVEFYFPTTPVTMEDGQIILLIKNEAAFKAEYGANSLNGITYYEWLDGGLSNGGEKPELQMPGDVNAQGERQYIRIDRVSYDDTNPWPVEPDGLGQSLEKPDAKLSLYGNDIENWITAIPSPGY